MSGQRSRDKVIRSRIFWPRDAGATYRIGAAVFECLCCVCVADVGVLAAISLLFSTGSAHMFYGKSAFQLVLTSLRNLRLDEGHCCFHNWLFNVRIFAVNEGGVGYCNGWWIQFSVKVLD